MIAIFKFRVNDLHPSKGKQIEFNTAKIEEFFQFKNEEEHIVFQYKSMYENDPLNGLKIKVYLKLSPARGDYKIYQNEDNSLDVKDFFIDKLHLDVEQNIDDYFALRKINDVNYCIYYIPKGEAFAKFYQACLSNSEYIIEDKREEYKTYLSNHPLQVIYYGAPGTGKSHTINEITSQQPKENVFRTTFHPDSDYSSFVGCYKPTKENNAITYQFVPQAFTNAYVRAWQTNDPVYLVIEEINRGNCAQIFGDLFQLLDRENGISEYPIKSDTDLGRYLAETFNKEEHRKDAEERVLSGAELVLPSNLYIWATMNTSDQSLFPIDSAFKRRWEWRYVKITKPEDKDWHLQDGTSWWAFIQKINLIINRMTNSADKQLGYFFVKADDGMVITNEKFVSKVCFYLWNDIFKTYATDDMENNLFVFDRQDGDTAMPSHLTFPDFYNEKGDVDDRVVERFIQNVLHYEVK